MSEGKKPREWTLSDGDNYFYLDGPKPNDFDPIIRVPDFKIIPKDAYDRAIEIINGLVRRSRECADDYSYPDNDNYRYWFERAKELGEIE